MCFQKCYKTKYDNNMFARTQLNIKHYVVFKNYNKQNKYDRGASVHLLPVSVKRRLQQPINHHTKRAINAFMLQINNYLFVSSQMPHSKIMYNN